MEEKEIYVVVAERDTYEIRDDSRPIAWETFIDEASLDDAKKRQQQIGDHYGKTRIAKLQFID